MTLIFGSRCKDGVIIVGDKKITTSEGASFFSDKIHRPFEAIVWGASGLRSFYDSYENRVNAAIQERERNKQPTMIADLRIILENGFETMAKLYGDILRDNLSVLIAQRPYQFAELWLIRGFGAPQRVDTCRSIGSGSPHGVFFLKKLWRQDISMREAARLAYFIIRYIEKFGLDDSVGVGSSRPNVWMLPDNPPREGTETEETSDNSIREPEEKLFEDFESWTTDAIKKIEDLANSLTLSKSNNNLAKDIQPLPSFVTSDLSTAPIRPYGLGSSERQWD